MVWHLWVIVDCGNGRVGMEAWGGKACRCVSAAERGAGTKVRGGKTQTQRDPCKCYSPGRTYRGGLVVGQGGDWAG